MTTYVAWVVEFILRNAVGFTLLFGLAGLGVVLRNRGRAVVSPLRAVLVTLSLV